MSRGLKVTLFVLFLLYASALLVIKQHKDALRHAEEIEWDKQWAEKKNSFEEKLKPLRSEVEQLRVLAEDPYKGKTLTDENKLILEDYEPSDRHAIVTMIGGDSYMHPYWMGALAVVQGLREAQTRVPNVIVMIRSQAYAKMPKFALDAFKRLGVQIIHIEGLNLKDLNVDIPGTWGEWEVFLLLLFI